MENDLAEAADTIAALINDEPASSDSADGTTDQSQPAGDGKDPAKAADTDKPEPKKAQDKEEGDAQDDTDGDDAAEPDTVEVEYEGTRYALPKELKDSFMRQVDYTKKTMALAEERKAVEAERAKLTNAPLPEQVQQQLATYQRLLADKVAEDQKVDWTKLLEEDPVEYLKQKQLAEERQKAFEAQQQEQKQKYQQEMGQTLAKEWEQLKAKRPDLASKEAFSAHLEKVKPSLAKVGYSAHEVDAILDHRAILVADIVHKYFELVDGKEKAIKKIEKLPPKVERPGVKTTSDGKSAKDLVAKVRRTGSVDDAASAIEALLN